MTLLIRFISIFVSIIICSLWLNLYSREIEVSPDGNITSIKHALHLAAHGDKIIVRGGIYYETDIIIEKSIELIGENQPIIDAQNKSEIITVKADGVIIKGFVIKNSGSSFLNDYAGIRLESVNNCIIENNTLLDNFFSIYLSDSENCLVLSNYVKSNAVKETTSGNGIHLWKCRNITIEGNTAIGNRDGIYLEFVTDSRINRNYCSGNLRYGLHFMFSHRDSYEYNTFNNNGAGVAVMYTRNVYMYANKFEYNWGPNSYGLLLKDITQSIIYKNSFEMNTTGIYMESSSLSILKENDFIDNGYALKILGNCTEDTITRNNFINNTFDVATNSSMSSNLFTENYWDKYKGYDLNRDTFGDVGYRPVSLFSIIVSKTPETIVLLKSIIVDILDLAEKIFPVLIPETLIDQKPLMHPRHD